jgi:iron complex transport system substrate-binding protein
VTRGRRSSVLAVALTVLLAVSTGRGWAAERVVSLNLCIDQLLVLLAPEKIAALSSLARDPSLSFVAKQAAQLPTVRPYAEAVLRLRPDLVLAGPYGAQTTLALLEARGVPVLRIGLPTSFAGIRAQIRSVAATLGEAERGEALIADMDRRLAELPRADPPSQEPPRTALAWEARGYTAGPGTLADAVLRAAGLENASDGRRVGLEALLANPPGLLAVPPPATYPSLATELLSHPATAAIPRRFVPPALTICAGPFTAEAAELLAR